MAQREDNERIVELSQELDTLLYAISHDLRAPLRAIDGFSLAVLEDYGDRLDEEGKEYLVRVRNAGKKINAYINALLQMSRQTREEIHRADVDFGKLAKDILTALQERNPKRKVRVVIEGDLSGRFDPVMARTVMEKLLDNAWKFTEGKDEAVIVVGASTREGVKAVYVEDNGAGFDMVFAGERLFGAFQRMHDGTRFPGLGTGLATVRRIVNRHGGKVWAESEPDRGTTIFFTQGSD